MTPHEHLEEVEDDLKSTGLPSWQEHQLRGQKKGIEETLAWARKELQQILDSEGLSGTRMERLEVFVREKIS